MDDADLETGWPNERKLVQQVFTVLGRAFLVKQDGLDV